MSEGRLAKPQLRDLHLSRAKRSLGLLVIAVASVGLAYKIFVSDVYERKVQEFYKHYDADKSVEKMNKAGLMQSAVSS